MGMTAEEVRKKLEENGFTFVDLAAYTVIEHRGEPVGSLYSDSVYLAQYYPSLNPDGVSTYYADAKKTIIMYSHSITELESAISWLLESPKRIETEKRKNRIDTIHRYFNERKSR